MKAFFRGLTQKKRSSHDNSPLSPYESSQAGDIRTVHANSELHQTYAMPEASYAASEPTSSRPARPYQRPHSVYGTPQPSKSRLPSPPGRTFSPASRNPTLLTEDNLASLTPQPVPPHPPPPLTNRLMLKTTPLYYQYQSLDLEIFSAPFWQQKKIEHVM